MKRILKAPEPAGLLAFKAKANANWQPSFDGLSGPLKRSVHQALVEEQGWLCCYCNRRIDSRSSHIEHLRPQSEFPQADLAYDNLLASCQRAEPASPHFSHPF